MDENNGERGKVASRWRRATVTSSRQCWAVDSTGLISPSLHLPISPPHVAEMSERIERRHIPYLPFHKQIIREICRPQKDDLLIIAKGLGLRRVSSRELMTADLKIVCALLKTYDKKEDLVLVINARPEDEAGIGDELGIMGVRDPGFRILTYEMSISER